MIKDLWVNDNFDSVIFDHFSLLSLLKLQKGYMVVFDNYNGKFPCFL